MHVLLGMGISLKMVYFPSLTPLEKKEFFILDAYQLQIASGLGVGHISTLLPVPESYLVQPLSDAMHAATVSVSLYVQLSCCVLVITHSPWLYNLSTPSSAVIPDFRTRGVQYRCTI